MFVKVVKLLILLALVSWSSDDKPEVTNFSSDIALYKSGMNNLKKREFSEAV